MINEQRIKKQVQKSISLKPTHIELKRLDKASNGMRGGKPKEVPVAELDVFIDDTKHNFIQENTTESGSFKKTRGISMLATSDNFEIKEGDYFTNNNMKYRVTYPGMLVKDVYNADLEVIK